MKLLPALTVLGLTAGVVVLLLAWQRASPAPEAGEAPDGPPPSVSDIRPQQPPALVTDVRGRPPSSPVRPPGAAPLPASFHSAGDLWQFAQAALASNAESTVHEGYMAARECLGVLSLWPDYAALAAGAGNTALLGPMTPARQVAIQTLATRCAGFLTAGRAQSLKLVKALRARADDLGGTIDEALRQQGTSRALDAVLTLLRSNSPSAREAGLMRLGDLWEAQHRLPDGDPRAEAFSLAAMLAVCDLGKDCGPAAFVTQFRCAVQSQCDSWLWDTWDAGMTPEAAAEVARFRQAIRKAVESNDLSMLGLLRR